MKKLVYVMIVTIITHSSLAQDDDIPTTTEFSGYFVIGPGLFNVQSNLLAIGPQLLQYGGHSQIELTVWAFLQ